MTRYLLALLIVPLFATAWQPAAAQVKASIDKTEPRAACTCPKEGEWKAQNVEGWMKCTGPVDFKRTLGEVKDKGTVWVLEPDCSRVFGEASRKKDEDTLMVRDVDDACNFTGSVNGDEDGVKMVIEILWKLTDDNFIEGEMHSNPSLQGMMCEYYRPFEIRYDKPIPEKDYDSRRKKMEKKLAKIEGEE